MIHRPTPSHQSKQTQRDRVQLPDIHPTKVPFVKNKLPGGIIPPPVTSTPSVKTPRHGPSCIYKGPFTISMYELRAKDWCDPARGDVLRLRSTSAVGSSILVGWLPTKRSSLVSGWQARSGTLYLSLNWRPETISAAVAQLFSKQQTAVHFLVVNGTFSRCIKATRHFPCAQGDKRS
jgi:hypothetical protein